MIDFVRKQYLLCFSIPFFIIGCSIDNHAVIAATGTTIGVEIGENPTSGITSVLGYKRSEFARVPSNRPDDLGDNYSASPKGADETGEVIMELHYSGLTSGNGIYQRLAVGTTAVQQDGASLMFARDNKGEINHSAVQAIKGVEAISPVSSEKINPLKQLSDSYKGADKDGKKNIDLVIAESTKNKYLSYSDLAIDHDNIDVSTLNSIVNDLSLKGLLKK